jgi:hypothetical protein
MKHSSPKPASAQAKITPLASAISPRLCQDSRVLNAYRLTTIYIIHTAPDAHSGNDRNMWDVAPRFLLPGSKKHRAYQPASGWHRKLKFPALCLRSISLLLEFLYVRDLHPQVVQHRQSDTLMGFEHQVRSRICQEITLRFVKYPVGQWHRPCSQRHSMVQRDNMQRHMLFIHPIIKE